MSFKETKKTAYGRIEISGDVKLEDLLAQLDITVRGKKTRLATKRAAGVVNKLYKSLVPVGKTGNLKNSIPTAANTPVREYSNSRGTTYLGIAGALYPQGAHSHLIEDGHQVKVSRGERKGEPPLSGSPSVEGKRELLKASNSTKKQQIAVMTKTILDAIKEDGG